MRLQPTMAPTGRSLPTDAATLDAMYVKGDFAALATRLSSRTDPREVALDLNWEQARMFDGGGFLVAYLYMTDLWRIGSADAGLGGDGLRQTAAMMMTYTLALVRLDGTKCVDVSAPAHRRDQLFARNAPVLRYLGTLPRATRMELGTVALAIEKATDPVRGADAVLCRGGLDEIIAGLKQQGDHPLQQARRSPEAPGKTYLVPSDPNFAPRFLEQTDWQPKRAAARAALPEELTRFLAVPADSAGEGK